MTALTEPYFILAIPTDSAVDFPSKDIWIGAGSNYAIVLNEAQVKDLHDKIHALLASLGKKETTEVNKQ